MTLKMQAPTNWCGSQIHGKRNNKRVLYIHQTFACEMCTSHSKYGFVSRSAFLFCNFFSTSTSHAALSPVSLPSTPAGLQMPVSASPARLLVLRQALLVPLEQRLQTRRCLSLMLICHILFSSTPIKPPFVSILSASSCQIPSRTVHTGTKQLLFLRVYFTAGLDTFNVPKIGDAADAIVAAPKLFA